MTEAYEAVPSTLKNLPNWVLWRLEERGDKKTKVPYSLSGRMASSTDGSTWHRFEEVKHSLPTQDHGIGFSFNSSGIIGIDLDHAILPDGKIDPMFEGLVHLDTYIEVSPSGKGLHIFVRCDQPPYEKGRRKNFPDGRGLEIYSSGRYFTITGNRWTGSAGDIKVVPVELIRSLCDPILNDGTDQKSAPPKRSHDSMEDDEIVRLASQAKNGKTFAALYAGNHAYPSPSEADAALSCMLSFYTRNPAQIVRILRSSKLYRPKWDEHPDYLTRTIDGALSTVKEQYKPVREHKPRASRKNEDEVPEYTSQQRGWFERNGNLYLEVIDTSGDIVEYSYAFADHGKLQFVDSLTVKEPSRKDDGTVELSGLKYVPRSLPINKDGQPILMVGIPDKGLLESIMDSDIMQIKNEMKNHITKYCELSPNDLDLCIYYALATWFYSKLSTVPYLRFRADTGKGKSRILKVISDLCFLPVKAGGASTASGTIRFAEYWHGTIVIDEADIKGEADDSGGYTNDMIKYLNLGFERGQYFIKSDKADPKQQEVFDPFCPKVIAMRGVFQDPATEGRCLSISPSETERADIPAILPAEYEVSAGRIRAMLAHYTLTHWGIVSDADPYPSFNDVECEHRLKQLGGPLAKVLSKVFPDGLTMFKHYIARRQVEVKADRAGSFVGNVVNTLYDRALEQEVVYPSEIAEDLATTSTKVARTLKDAGIGIEYRHVTIPVPAAPNQPPRTKRLTKKVIVAKSARAWREVVRRYIIAKEQQGTLSKSNDSIPCPDSIRSCEYLKN